MPKQMKSVTNSLSTVNKSRHKKNNRRMKRKRKKESSRSAIPIDEVTREASVKIEEGSSSRLTPENEDIPALLTNASSINIKIGNGTENLPLPNNGNLENNFDREINALFNKLCYSEDVLSSLPNRTWAIHSAEVPDKRIVVSSMMMHNSHGNGLEPLYIKQIIFDEKLNFDLFLLNSRIVLKDKPSTISTMHDFEDLVDYVESLKLCSGGPAVNQYNKINPECAYKDPLNKWRHNLCSLEIGDGEICDSCQSLEEILRKHAQRTKQTGKLRNSVAAKRKQRSKD